MASLAHHNSGVLIPRDELEELTEAMATVFRIGSRFTPRLIERLDLTDGDPDNEPGGDDEPLEANGDTQDGAWIEWNTMRGSQKRGPNVLPTYNEDDEDDDPAGVSDEDGQNTLFDAGRDNGPGCLISDSDYAVDDMGCDPDEGF